MTQDGGHSQLLKCNQNSLSKKDDKKKSGRPFEPFMHWEIIGFFVHPLIYKRRNWSIDANINNSCATFKATNPHANSIKE